MPSDKDHLFWDALMENKKANKLVKKNKKKVNMEHVQELAEKYNTSKQEVEKILTLFHLMDDDGSGTISSTEVAKMLNELGIDVSPKVVQAVMRTSDSSGDGEIDFEEFLATITSKIKLQNCKAEIHVMISKMDNDPNRILSAEELVVAWRETLSTNLTVKEAFALIHQADTQGKGMATIHEFITMCQTV